MKEIAKTGYWNAETAHNHHVHCKELSKWICNFFNERIFDFETIRDYGCGLGNYLKDLQDYGFKNLVGFEGDSSINKVFGNIIKQDLTIPLTTYPKGNVISLEIGEHIPKEYQDIFIDNITSSCNNYLIMSWAIKGQPGFGHVNCLDNEEVISEIEKRGFQLLEKETKEVRELNLSEAPWFKNTLLIFKNGIK